MLLEFAFSILPYDVPVSLKIARSIVVDPSDWTVDRDRLVHPQIGAVIFTPTPILIETPHGIWKPARLTQHFLKAAIHWRKTEYPKRMTSRAIGALVR